MRKRDIFIIVIVIMTINILLIIVAMSKMYNTTLKEKIKLIASIEELEGICLDVNVCTIDGKEICQDSKSVKEVLGVDKVIASYKPWLTLEDDIDEYQMIAYDDAFIDKINPIMKHGIWLNASKTERNVLHVVVGCSEQRYDIGEEIVLSGAFDNGDRKYVAKIVGVLDSQANVILSGNDTISNCYTLYSKMDKNMLYMFFSVSELREYSRANKLNLVTALTGKMLLCKKGFNRSMRDQEILNQEVPKIIKCNTWISINDMTKGYKHYINSMIELNYIIMIMTVLLLIIVQEGFNIWSAKTINSYNKSTNRYYNMVWFIHEILILAMIGVVGNVCMMMLTVFNVINMSQYINSYLCLFFCNGSVIIFVKIISIYINRRKNEKE